MILGIGPKTTTGILVLSGISFVGLYTFFRSLEEGTLTLPTGHQPLA